MSGSGNDRGGGSGNDRGNDRDRLDIAVVGGGISGLAAAHRLGELAEEHRVPLRIRLIEAGSRLGGRIRTEQVDGLLLESGPDQFVTHKPAGLALCERVGLADEVLHFNTQETPIHVIRNGRPLPLPVGFRLVAPTRILPLLRSPLFSWRAKLRMAREPFVPPRNGERTDESLGAFVTRRFGRELTERIVEPVVGGIFTADVDKLSMEMAMPRFLDLERKYGSITKAIRAAAKMHGGGPKAAFCSLRGGLGRLVERLASRLPENSLRLDCPVVRLEANSNTGGWLLHAGGRELDASAVILASPAHVSANLLRPLDPELAGALEVLPHAPCATINLVYPRSAVKRSLKGFGFFVPAIEGLSILACSYVSLKFPDRAPEDSLLMRVFVGGARKPHLLEYNDERLARLAHRTLVGLLRLEGEPRFQRVARYPMAMPQYPVGYAQTAQEIERRRERHPGLYLCGAVTGSFGLPDCVATGEKVAQQAFDAWLASSTLSLRNQTPTSLRPNLHNTPRGA